MSGDEEKNTESKRALSQDLADTVILPCLHMALMLADRLPQLREVREELATYSRNFEAFDGLLNVAPSQYGEKVDENRKRLARLDAIIDFIAAIQDTK